MIEVLMAYDDGNATVTTVSDWGEALNTVETWMSEALIDPGPGSTFAGVVEVSMREVAAVLVERARS